MALSNFFVPVSYGQRPIYVTLQINFADLDTGDITDSTAFMVASVPDDAVWVDGFVSIQTVTGAADTIDVGTSGTGDAYLDGGSINALTTLALTGFAGKTGDLYATIHGAADVVPTTGTITIVAGYVRTTRADVSLT